MLHSLSRLIIIFGHGHCLESIFLELFVLGLYGNLKRLLGTIHKDMPRTSGNERKTGRVRSEDCLLPEYEAMAVTSSQGSLLDLDHILKVVFLDLQDSLKSLIGRSLVLIITNNP